MPLHPFSTATFADESSYGTTHRDVSKTYSNGVQALRDAALTVPVGMYGLLDPNGAGKSTLMLILTTVQEPDEGSICLSDIDVLSHLWFR